VVIFYSVCRLKKICEISTIEHPGKAGKGRRDDLSFMNCFRLL